MKFSQRMGFVEVNSIIQLNSIDSDLRNDLWNFVYVTVGGKDDKCASLWANFFKKPIDEYHLPSAIEYYKAFFTSCEPYEIYDILEFILEDFGYYQGSLVRTGGIEDKLNTLLIKNLSGYRFLNGVCAPITDQQELDSIQTTLSQDDKFSSAREHITTALQHLSHKTNPDFRNSIKESILAVEAIVRVICKNKDVTLGGGLSKLEEKGVVVHTALKEGFKKIYGRASDTDGIRHALTDESHKPDFDDAKFMLVACSAFVNYLIAKGFK